MKKIKNFKNSSLSELPVDVVEHMFVEWLIRRGVFAAFKSNYEHAFSLRVGFHERLRGQIRRSLSGNGYGVSHLITSSFLFLSTPEGAKFWTKQSAAWERFCAKFQANL